MKANLVLGCGAVLVAAVLGCGSSSGSGGAGGTGSTTASTTAATTSSTKAATSATSGTSTGTGAGGSTPFFVPQCTGIPASPPSNGSCITVPGTTSASTGTGAGGAAPTIPCNPVKDAECNIAGGEACDASNASPNGFECFPPPNPTAVCGDCTNDYCADGATCVVADGAASIGKCAKFCCTDADCGGAAGSCEKTFLGDPNVGLCGTVSQ